MKNYIIFKSIQINTWLLTDLTKLENLMEDLLEVISTLNKKEDEEELKWFNVLKADLENRIKEIKGGK